MRILYLSLIALSLSINVLAQDIHCSFADSFFTHEFTNETEVDFEIVDEYLVVETIYNCHYYKIYIPNIIEVKIYESDDFKKYIGFVAKREGDIYRECERSLGGSIDDRALIGGSIISNLDEVDDIPEYFTNLFKELGL